MIQKWQKPNEGWFKCNVDAALLNQYNQIGYGCVIRDDQGEFIAARNGVLNGPMNPALAKALSCKEALSWLKNLSYNKVIVELDAQQLVHALQGFQEDLSYFGSIVEDCKILSKDLGDCTFVFVKQSANQMAHSLAKATDSMLDQGVWFFNLPFFISHVLALDKHE